MIVSFPFTNPVAFNLEGTYHNYMDAFGVEQLGCHVQPWAKGDLISWQVCWYKRSTAYTTDVRLDIEVNGVSRLFRQYSGIQGDVSGGTFYTTYYISMTESPAYSNGCYVFSDRIENVTDSGNQRMLHEGDRFRFILTVGGTRYESGPQAFVADKHGTKLLHYSHTRKRLFDTQFSSVQKGYEIRLHAMFEHPEPVVNSEFMESYERDIELVSAVPAENIVLEVGGNRGVPDWLVRNLNHIFHCDIKSIDGVAYELTPDAKIEPERVDGYNPAFLRIGMARKRNVFSLQTGAADKKLIPIVIDKDSILVHLEFADADLHWYLDDDSSGDLIGAEVSQWNGIGSAEVRLTLPKNTGDVDRKWRITVRNYADDSVIAEVSHIQKRTMVGIDYGIVGDNFFVRERTIRN